MVQFIPPVYNTVRKKWCRRSVLLLFFFNFHGWPRVLLVESISKNVSSVTVSSVTWVILKTSIRLERQVFTSPAGAYARYCDEYVCLSVCLSAKISRNYTHDLYQFLWMLPMDVARSSSGVVVIRYVLPVLWMVSGTFSIMGRIEVWISLRRIDFTYLLIYSFTVKSDRIPFPIIKGHNILLSFQNYSHTEVKEEEEQRNLAINGKNYRNASCLSHCYYSNG